MKSPAREYEWSVEGWYLRVDSKKEKGMLMWECRRSPSSRGRSWDEKEQDSFRDRKTISVEWRCGRIRSGEETQATAESEGFLTNVLKSQWRASYGEGTYSTPPPHTHITHLYFKKKKHPQSPIFPQKHLIVSVVARKSSVFWVTGIYWMELSGKKSNCSGWDGWRDHRQSRLWDDSLWEVFS